MSKRKNATEIIGELSHSLESSDTKSETMSKKLKEKEDKIDEEYIPKLEEITVRLMELSEMEEKLKRELYQKKKQAAADLREKFTSSELDPIVIKHRKELLRMLECFGGIKEPTFFPITYFACYSILDDVVWTERFKHTETFVKDLQITSCKYKTLVNYIREKFSVRVGEVTIDSIGQKEDTYNETISSFYIKFGCLPKIDKDSAVPLAEIRDWSDQFKPIYTDYLNYREYEALNDVTPHILTTEHSVFVVKPIPPKQQ
jgi:hypothetical protein